MTLWQLDIPTGSTPRLTATPARRGRVSMTGRAWTVLVGGRHPRITRIRAAYRRRQRRWVLDGRCGQHGGRRG